jgi:hypothetical protein
MFGESIFEIRFDSRTNVGQLCFIHGGVNSIDISHILCEYYFLQRFPYISYVDFFVQGESLANTLGDTPEIFVKDIDIN